MKIQGQPGMARFYKRGRKEKEKETKHQLSKRAKWLARNTNLKYLKFDPYDGLTCSWLMIQLNKHAKQSVMLYKVTITTSCNVNFQILSMSHLTLSAILLAKLPRKTLCLL